MNEVNINDRRRAEERSLLAFLRSDVDEAEGIIVNGAEESDGYGAEGIILNGAIEIDGHGAEGRDKNGAESAV